MPWLEHGIFFFLNHLKQQIIAIAFEKKYYNKVNGK
jgi:hypothetical protein